MQLFNSLGIVCDGYAKENVTPYMHTMAYYAPPPLMQKHSGIKKFTGQGDVLLYIHKYCYSNNLCINEHVYFISVYYL